MKKSTIVSLIAGVAVGVAATKVAEKYNLVEKVSAKFSKKDEAGICQNVLNSAATVAAEEKPETKEEFSPVK